MKRRDGKPMCTRKGCRRARHEGARVCPEHYADQLWSMAVRARDKSCQAMFFLPNSPCVGALQADHLISRTYRSTRWLIDVGAALCLGHHMYVTEHPLEHVELAVALMGQELYDLRRREAMRMDGANVDDAIEVLEHLVGVARVEAVIEKSEPDRLPG
jgi:hypothetical protein